MKFDRKEFVVDKSRGVSGDESDLIYLAPSDVVTTSRKTDSSKQER